MSRRFERLFRPDAGRLATERSELLGMINGHPACNGAILRRLGVLVFYAAAFNQALAEHLAPRAMFMRRS